MELSSLIGKQILSPAGEMLGYVKGACLSRDRKKLACLVCIDGEEEEFYLPYRAVLAAEDAVIAGKARLKAPVGTACPVGMPAFTERGESLGAIADYLFGGEDEPLFVAEREGVRTPMPVSRVSIGGTAILRDSARPPRPPRKRTEGEPKRESARMEVSAEGTAESLAEGTAEGTADVTAPSAAQQRVPFDRCNLLGRKVKRSVYDAYGVPIAAAGERITKETLSAARRANRLLQLAVNTLTNLG